MGFADLYFKRYQTEKRLILSSPSSNLEIVVIIPCFNEDNTIKTLESLYFCLPTKKDVEVIVLINFPEGQENKFENQHLQLFRIMQNWADSHSRERLKFFLLIKKLPEKTAGVGHARKIVMDEALRRFNLINNPIGIIASFDADCICETNYLTVLETLFENYPKTKGCSIYFEHPVSGNEYSQSVYNAIIQYELYLRYYIEALRLINYPFAYHCVGSAFAVRADAYAMQGGMNKRKAGEEFYFLQKIIPLGNYRELNETKIIPSPRESNRVPFGTGKIITKILQSDDPAYLTYNPNAFKCLGNFFLDSANCFKQTSTKIKLLLESQNPALIEYLKKNDFIKKIDEINSNCSNILTFKKRFFTWFNGLMVLKFLNDSHRNSFNKIPVSEAAAIILKNQNDIIPNKDSRYLLDKLRNIQRNSVFKSGL